MTTKQTITDILNKMIGEDIDVGDNTYCKTCEQHIAAGDCSCSGRNQALADLRVKVPGVVGEIESIIKIQLLEKAMGKIPNIQYDSLSGKHKIL